MFQVELVFPPDFPDAPPYVHFLTSMFHPHISPLGVPYLRHLIMWNHLEPKEKSVSSLLTVLEPGQTRRPGSGRAGHPRLSKRPHACSRRPSVLQRRRAESRAWAAWAPQRSPGAAQSRRLTRGLRCVLTTQALVGLLASNPSPEPATHLNLEAASLAFSRSYDDKKEYKKQVKKRVQRSMDG